MINLKIIFQDFNPSKFVVYSCLLVFSLLFSLRLDDTIEWSYWVVFLPIWLWKFLVIFGAIVGSYVWFRHPLYRLEGDSFIQFKAMVMTTSMHLMLLVFDILACDKLETGTHSWMFVFIPLMFMSIVAIGFCVWAIKNERSFELELLCSVNILQFIFLALRLDNVIKWSWVIVFIPIWILMCISMIGVIYAIILAIILSRSPDIIRDQRRGNLTTAVGYSLLVIPMLIFEILLANRLDEDNHFKYTAITVPLFISLFTLILLSFGAKGGNQYGIITEFRQKTWLPGAGLCLVLEVPRRNFSPLTLIVDLPVLYAMYSCMDPAINVGAVQGSLASGWFGIRKDFCNFILGVCPCLQEYGNISYSAQKCSNPESEGSGQVSPKRTQHRKNPLEDSLKVVVPVVSIETPD